MKKEDLTVRGLTDEQAQIAVDVWNESIKSYVPKKRFDEVNNKRKEAYSTIESLKTNSKEREELQKQVKEYKNKLTEVEANFVTILKEYALKDVLNKSGVLDTDYIIYKQGGLDKFSFDKDGKPIGIADVLKPLKKTSPHLFKAENEGAAQYIFSSLQIKKSC